MSDWAGSSGCVVLLAANAFFVGAEFAVISARRSQIEPLAEQGSRSAKTALWAMEHATLMLAMSQLGITICSLLILNVSEPAIHHLLEVPLHLTGWSAEAVSTIAFVITLVLVSYLHVVFGEMVPKNLSFSLPDRAVLLLAPPLVFLARVFQPDHRRAERDRQRRAAALRRRAEERGQLAPSRSKRCRRSSTSRAVRACSTTRAARSRRRSSSRRSA